MAYWLSEPVESLLDAIDSGKKQATCDVLIVGSGYGGAIAAMRLADPSRKVILFERGKEYALGDFPENLGELPGHVRFMRASDKQPLGYAGALFDLRIADKVAALVGNGLGGGSLINANVALKPDLETLRQPEWPKGVRDSATTLLETMDSVGTQWLGVVNDRETPGKLKALDRLARTMDKRAECRIAPLTVSFDGGTNPIGVRQAPCVRCGNCVTGCNVGAKTTLAMNLLPLAKARGAEIYTGATVISVEPKGDPTGKGGWIVRFRRTATEKGVLRGEVRELHARVVVLAAGTLGSTEILLRSQARKKIQCSAQLGKRFSTNGDTFALGYAQQSRVGALATTGSLDPTQSREVGPTISGYAQLMVRSKKQEIPPQKLTLEDGAIPISLARVFAELAVSGSLIKRYVEINDPAWLAAHPEKDPLAVHPEALQHSQLLLGMGDDGAAGELRLAGFAGEVDAANADESRLAILWPEGEGTKASQFLRATDECMGNAERQGFDGGNYIQNPAWRPLPADFAAELTGEAPEGPMLTVHPLGGCSMGDDAKAGVVNEFGQVFRLARGKDGKSQESLYSGLYVMDGAVVPRALGVNPFLTISALAWRASEQWLKTLGWTENEKKNVGIESPPVSRSCVKTVPEHVSAAIVERLLGSLEPRMPDWFRAVAKDPLATRNWLAAEITIEIPDVYKWLENPDAGLNAVCKLYANKRDSDTFDEENVTLVAKASGIVKLLARDGPGSDGEARSRALASFLAYFERSGIPQGSKNQDADWGGGLWRVACNHAHWRVLEYSFTFQIPDERRPWTLTGRKELAYHPGKPNVWTALIELPIELAPENADFNELYRGILTVDLIHLSRNALARVRNAVHTPAALMALIGAGMLALRVLFQTHFWSFRAPDYREQRPAGKREPDPIRVSDGALIKPVPIPFLVPAGGEGEEPLSLRLWRYPHPKVPRGDKVLLIHGLAHGANVFATRTIERPLAAHLHDEGYEVWLLDYRLSPALGKASTRQSTMDEIAQYDIAEAVRYVYREAGEPIRVFAHCIGAGCFSMSVLGGHCQDSTAKRSMVRAAAIHAVPPWVVPSKANRLRANLAAFAKDVIGQILFDPIPPDSRSTFADTMIDRFAGSLPWPHADREAHDYDRAHSRMGRVICNRMTLFYGTEWVHGNLSEATHRNLCDLVGVGNIETFRQIFFIAQRERITDREGRNVYLTLDNIKEHWTFPTLFAHGAQNEVFSPVSTRRSAVRMDIVQKAEGYPKQKVYFEEIPGYGHMDFLFGTHAHRDVYPKIGDFFSGEESRRSRLGLPNPELDPQSEPPARPLVGPIIGWARLQGKVPVLRIWVEARDDITTAPSDVVFHARLADGTWVQLASQGEKPSPSNYDRHWYVLSDVTVSQDFGLPKQVNARVRYFDPAVFVVKRHPPKPKGILEERTPSRTPPREGSLIYLDNPWFRRLAGLEKREGCTFLAGSCRHPGSPFEREASDQVFAGMLKEVGAGADHVLLVGDQIYADATADVFDTQELGERYSGRYREAFQSRHASALFASVPVYMAIDDHEFGDNWEGMPCTSTPRVESVSHGRDELFEIALDAARSYQRAMGPDSEAPPNALWYAFTSAGDLPFFVMDVRSERCQRTSLAGVEGARMVVEQQMKALEDWLKKHRFTKTPKFIVCGSPIGPVTKDEVKNHSLWRNSDWWFGYPRTLERLVNLMVELCPSNLVFVSGDYHFSAIADLVFYAKNGKCAEAKQIIASGLFAPMPFANERPEDFTFDRWTTVPVAGSDSSVGVKASLLARGCSHFLRVTALPRGDRWDVNATAIDADGKEIGDAKVC